MRSEELAVVARAAREGLLLDPVYTAKAFLALEDTARRKAALLLDWFPSQRSKPWFTEDLFLALMRLRGMEAGSPSGYAEGFYGRKVVLGGPEPA